MLLDVTLVGVENEDAVSLWKGDVQEHIWVVNREGMEGG